MINRPTTADVERIARDETGPLWGALLYCLLTGVLSCLLVTALAIAAFFFPLVDDSKYCLAATCVNNTASIQALINITGALQEELEACGCNSTIAVCPLEVCTNNTQSIEELFNITSGLCSEEQCANNTQSIQELFNITSGLCTNETCSFLNQSIQELYIITGGLQEEIQAVNASCQCNATGFCSEEQCSNNTQSIQDLYNITEGLCPAEQCNNNTQSIQELYNITDGLQEEIQAINASCQCNTTGLCSEEQCSNNTNSITELYQLFDQLNFTSQTAFATAGINITDATTGAITPYVITISTVGVYVPIPYGLPLENENFMDNSGHNFTIQIPGFYWVQWAGSIDVELGGSRSVRIGIAKNGVVFETAAIHFTSDTTDRYDAVTVYAICPLSQGDVISFYVGNFEDTRDIYLATFYSSAVMIQPTGPVLASVLERLK